MLKIDLKAALMKIRRRRLRRKGIQANEVEFLRVQREGRRRCLLPSENKVELRVGVETLELRVSLRWRKTVDRRVHHAVLEGLGDGNAPLDDRTRESCSWCYGAEAEDVSMAIGHSRDDVLN